MSVLKSTYPLYQAGRAEAANADLPALDKSTGEVAIRVARADATMFDTGIAAAAESFPATRKLPHFKRQAILQHIVKRATERHEELSRGLCIEAGEPTPRGSQALRRDEGFGNGPRGGALCDGGNDGTSVDGGTPSGTTMIGTTVASTRDRPCARTLGSIPSIVDLCILGRCRSLPPRTTRRFLTFCSPFDRMGQFEKSPSEDSP